MHNNIREGAVNIDFIDGYLTCALRVAIADQGVEGSGLLNFYAARVTERLGALLEYEVDVASYVIEHCRNQRVLEIGTGLGELPIMLALNGMIAGGMEYFAPRAEAAARIRADLALCFPEIMERYELILGAFPEAVSGTPWRGADLTLLFTNVGSGWDEDRTRAVIASFPEFGDVILDLSLFGKERNDEPEREALFDEVAAAARSATRLDISSGRHYAHFAFQRQFG